MVRQLTEKGRYNKNVFAEVLENVGFDSKYLLEWGIPDDWQESFWDDPEIVLSLLMYFEERYQIYDNRDGLEDEN
jgi:hypothetical protein